ncbi:PREDICTED: neuromedin-U receptor 1 [Chinchilla lanigera]|uniref:Neuromedin U receptor 1 n=1 Tax=Chinchilla lanigera TaxID=34839 RepID=A0A8C2YQU8_CHILA|nr:PREDICTED: neuromedin-U receptor 1 [Chinchilla lanigera]
MTPLCPDCPVAPGDPSPGDARSPPPCNGSEPTGDFDPEDLNLTDEALRLKYLGPRRTELFAPMCTVYLLIFAVGTVGNALTCTVILRRRAMRTPTNLYLLSLAAADLLLLLLGLPLELYELAHNYPFLLGSGGCFFRTLLFETVCLASVLSVTALSVERYMAVVRPLQARAGVTRARVRRALLLLWGLAVLCAVPNASLHGLQQLQVPCRGAVPDSAVCTLVRSRGAYGLVVQGTALLFFCLPLGAISALYLRVGLRLRRHRRLLSARAGSRAARALPLRDRGRTQVTKMLVVLVVVFAICWAPFHADRLMWSFVSQWTESLLLAFQYLHVTSGVFFYLGSAANPVLYSLLSSRFRESFREALGLRSRGRRRRAHHRSYSLSRVTTASSLCDPSSQGSRAQPPPANGGPEGQGEAQRCPRAPWPGRCPHSSSSSAGTSPPGLGSAWRLRPRLRGPSEIRGKHQEKEEQHLGTQDPPCQAPYPVPRVPLDPAPC